jgi:hypothetical protein
MENDSTKYTIQKNSLQIGETVINFEHIIKEVLKVGDMLILLLIKQDGYLPAENVFGVSLHEKKIKWQIAKLKYETGEICPFVGMKFANDQLYLNNWCDVYLIVNPFTGEILEKSAPAKY